MLKNARSWLFFAVLLLAFGLIMNACTDSVPSGPDGKAMVSSSSLLRSFGGESTYPQSASMVLRYRYGRYMGNQMTTQNGSSLMVRGGSFTPPAGTAPGSDVTVTMTINKDDASKLLYFDFGPSGGQFDPPAAAWFDWHEIGVRNARLYLVRDDGEFVEQEPDAVDLTGDRFMVYFDHFSRYAIAWGD